MQTNENSVGGTHCHLYWAKTPCVFLNYTIGCWNQYLRFTLKNPMLVARWNLFVYYCVYSTSRISVSLNRMAHNGKRTLKNWKQKIITCKTYYNPGNMEHRNKRTWSQSTAVVNTNTLFLYSTWKSFFFFYTQWIRKKMKKINNTISRHTGRVHTR